MLLDYRKWKPKTRVWWIVVIAIVSFIFFASRGHAEETIGDHIRDGVFDTLAATAAFAGAAQQAATGNFINGATLAVLGSKEAWEACGEFRAAWDLYYEGNSSDTNECYNEPNTPDLHDRQ